MKRFPTPSVEGQQEPWFCRLKFELQQANVEYRIWRHTERSCTIHQRSSPVHKCKQLRFEIVVGSCGGDRVS